MLNLQTKLHLMTRQIFTASTYFITLPQITFCILMTFNNAIKLLFKKNLMNYKEDQN